MMKRIVVLVALALFGAGYAAGTLKPFSPVVAEAAARETRVFEARIYTTHEGRLDALNKRFENHTVGLFEKHGMTNIGYWVPRDSTRTLVYVLSHANREAARESWRNFSSDPVWREARAASEEDGAIVQRVESIFMDPTTYSPLK